MQCIRAVSTPTRTIGDSLAHVVKTQWNDNSLSEPATCVSTLAIAWGADRGNHQQEGRFESEETRQKTDLSPQDP